MPRVQFSEENVVKNGPSFPKFVLEKGETARIVLLEDPWSEYVHALRKPKLVNGVPVKEIKKRRDDSTYEDYEYEFAGSILCLGDAGILKESGSDPSSCPICAAAVASDRFSAPKIRYAMHVVRYDLEPGSTSVNDEPFGARAQVWAFTEGIFAELYALKKEWGDLKSHDLILNRDMKAQYANNYKITVAQKAAWMEDEARQKTIASIMRPEKLAPDLAEFCGRRKPAKNIEFDIQAVNTAWDVATGVHHVSTADAAIQGVGSLTTGLDDILTSANGIAQKEWAVDPEDVKAAEASTKPAPATSLADLGLDEGETDEGQDVDDQLAKLLAGINKD